MRDLPEGHKYGTDQIPHTVTEHVFVFANQEVRLVAANWPIIQTGYACTA
ncbi:hypothetical protein GNI_180920 [Gregarina niphandrodes]|uniref:Uncharacterized protein n=1 Tax=Gregarina niphandrodes TaxID=110365 RepID=A0A023AWZ4_GRENI|nr:hypothetical protein GNI_180920 [Gregarina niphandrodes]EZG43239.1 hypothetical protein GNI_180920 [Gregarina niphandrodes]|eukprot:XP_011133507.1 hypothetical protein GNI_180920 [Gregarina niphandrodes]